MRSTCLAPPSPFLGAPGDAAEVEVGSKIKGFWTDGTFRFRMIPKHRSDNGHPRVAQIVVVFCSCCCPVPNAPETTLPQRYLLSWAALAGPLRMLGVVCIAVAPPIRIISCKTELASHPLPLCVTQLVGARKDEEHAAQCREEGLKKHSAGRHGER